MVGPPLMYLCQALTAYWVQVEMIFEPKVKRSSRRWQQPRAEWTGCWKGDA